jgi:undecaprenyl-diphosphatase
MEKGMRKAVEIARRWLAQRDLVVVVSLFLVIALVLGFAEIADEVGEGGIGFDQRLLLALREPGKPADPIGPSWFENLWLNITALGSAHVVTLIALAVLGFLLIVKEWRTALVFAVAMIGGALGSTVLKELFERSRPEVVHRLVDASGLSFPSGHSLISAVVYPTLGALITRLVPQRPLKLYVIVVALLLMLLIGFSRIYLGVHYPSDVLAGWMLGLGWAIVCWLAMRALQRRHVVEPPGLPPEAAAEVVTEAED